MQKRFLIVAALCLLVALLFQNCAGGFHSADFGQGSTGLSSQTGNSNTNTNPNPSPTPTPSPTVTPVTHCDAGYKLVSGACAACAAPRHYQYSFPTATALKCSPTESTLFEIDVPDQGYALARSTLVFQNNNTTVPYYWNAQILVGNFSVAWAAGDDICPAASTPTKTVMGYGQLTASNHHLVVRAYQGADGCVDGSVLAPAGNSVDVWVEDPAPECAKQDINLVSTYDVMKTNSPNYVAGIFPSSTFPYYAWTNSMTPLLTVAVPPTPGRSKILVLGSVEGTPVNPTDVSYTCGGSTSPHLIGQVASNNLGILAQAEGPLVTLNGGGTMGHLVLSPQMASPAAYDPIYLSSLQLIVGSNLSSSISVTTGGCCGDGKIGFVKSP